MPGTCFVYSLYFIEFLIEHILLLTIYKGSLTGPTRTRYVIKMPSDILSQNLSTENNCTLIFNFTYIKNAFLAFQILMKGINFILL